MRERSRCNSLPHGQQYIAACNLLAINPMLQFPLPLILQPQVIYNFCSGTSLILTEAEELSGWQRPRVYWWCRRICLHGTLTSVPVSGTRAQSCRAALIDVLSLRGTAVSSDVVHVACDGSRRGRRTAGSRTASPPCRFRFTLSDFGSGREPETRVQFHFFHLWGWDKQKAFIILPTKEHFQHVVPFFTRKW